MAIINGKRVSIPTPKDVDGSQIKKAINLNPNRRLVIEKEENSFETIKDDGVYKLDDFTKISNIPDRTKGNFFQLRSDLSKNIIKNQVIDIGTKLFRNQDLKFDEQNCDWLIIPNYRLPKNWHFLAKETPLLIVFPSDYPNNPPIGFYLKADLQISPNGHFYNLAYHSAAKEPLESGWKWYCVYIENGAWQPHFVKYIEDWKKGDNLWTYFQLITEVLESTDH